MNWKVALVASAAVAALMAGPAYGQADQTKKDQDQTAAKKSAIETVVVTGMRASTLTAVKIKQDSQEFVDAIVAQDIGKLPDNTVVDALQHVPGIQVQHGNGTGENDQIWIRGLPDIATTLNGRDIFTTTGRFVSLADVPAELLSQVVVHKSSQAEDIEGGLAGLVNIKLHRPFDFDGMEVAGTVQGAYSSIAKHVDPKASVLFSDRWQTGIGEIGMLLDVSYNKRHYIDEDAFDYYSGATATDGTTSAHAPETIGGIQYPGSRERASVNFSTQWRPNSHTEVFAELFYSRYKSPHSVNFLIGLPGNSNPVTNLTTVTDPNGNVLMKSEDLCCFNLTSNQSFRDKTDTYQFATGANWTLGNLILSSELDYTNSRYSRDGAIVDTAIFQAVSFDSNFNGQGTPNFTAADPKAWLVPANYHPTQLFDQWTRQSGDELDIRGDGTYAFDNGWLNAIDFGVRYANRFGKNRADTGGAISCYSATPANPSLFNSTACNGGAWFLNDVTQILPGGLTQSAGKFFDGERQWGLQTWMNADPNWTLNNIQKLRAAFGQPTTMPAADPSNSFDDREIGYAGYVKADYGFDVAGMPLTGNLGVRMVYTTATQNAYLTSVDSSGNITYSPLQTNSNDFNWMPSFNAKLAIRDDLQLRFALSKTVERPTFAQLNPGLYLSSGSATFQNNGTAGNPKLSPVKSNNVDLGLGYYFDGQGAITGTAFYRQINGYVQYKSAPEVHGGLTYQVTRPQNSGQGFLQGFELAYTQWYDQLPGLLGGFGLSANTTFIEGHFRDIVTGQIEPYAGVSRWSFNIIPMYQRGPFSMRLSYDWRSSYQVGYTFSDATSVNPATVYTKPYGELGLSVNYDWNDRVTLTFDMNNVLDSLYQDHFGSGALAAYYPRDTRHYDRVYELGLRYRM